MRIVFFGTGPFAIAPLEAVAADVCLVVTQPDRRTGRGMAEQPSPVKVKALELGLPVETPEKARAPEFVELVRALNADFLLVASYGQILSVALLESAKRGGINLHGSILPKYRGAAPIQRAILNGERETGVTLMQMDKGMDTGDIIDIKTILIGDDETYGELQERLSKLAALQIKQWAPRITFGDYPRAQQNQEEGTIAAKITKEEAELKFERDAQAEYNRFRAFTPSPGAFLNTKFGKVKISEARLSPSPALGEGRGAGGRGSRPGTVILPSSAQFGDGALELLQVQPEGRKRMSGRDFFNGMRLKTGDSLI